MKKVMLLAPESLCDSLRDALENKYTTLPCSDPSSVIRTHTSTANAGRI